MFYLLIVNKTLCHLHSWLAGQKLSLFTVFVIVISWAFFFVSLDFPPCGSGEFQCSNQVCIDEKQRCDGKTDCVDNSDEIECGNNSHLLTLKLVRVQKSGIDTIKYHT